MRDYFTENMELMARQGGFGTAAIAPILRERNQYALGKKRLREEQAESKRRFDVSTEQWEKDFALKEKELLDRIARLDEQLEMQKSNTEFTQGMTFYNQGAGPKEGREAFRTKFAPGLTTEPYYDDPVFGNMYGSNAYSMMDRRTGGGGGFSGGGTGGGSFTQDVSFLNNLAGQYGTGLKPANMGGPGLRERTYDNIMRALNKRLSSSGRRWG